MDSLIQISADGIRLEFDARTGLIAQFTVTDDGAVISPLHRAPWVGEEEIPDDAAPHMRTLGGDFFCAPFGQVKDGAPLHGWPANAPWELITVSPGKLSARLSHRVNRAEVIKELWLCPDHPFVYQRHTFVGGDGEVPVANHANVSVPNGAIIRTSAKQCWMTPPDPQEIDPVRGRSGLIYPACSNDPSAFPSIHGTTDLTRYPWFPKHEDFVVGIEASGHNLGWTAVTRPEEGDLFLSLRDVRALPMTMLWHSNGGRDYPPWSGRHFGCLGVEEGAAAHVLGSKLDRTVVEPGALALSSETSVQVTHIVGAINWPSGSPVESVEVEGGTIKVSDENNNFRIHLLDTEAFSSTDGLA